MLRLFPAFAAAVAALACGVVHGVWTDRWHLGPEPGTTVGRLTQINLNLDGWTGVVVPFRGNHEAGIAASVLTRWTQHRTGRTVDVFLVCGRPGPVSIHTPDVCYGAVGYEVSKPAPFTSSDGSASFWTARFRKVRAAENSELRIYWAWNAGQGWQAPSEPRLTFARYPVLIKLYLIQEIGGSGDSAGGNDPAVELMNLLLGELQQTLFPAS